MSSVHFIVYFYILCFCANFIVYITIFVCYNDNNYEHTHACVRVFGE